MSFWQEQGKYEYEVEAINGGGCRYTGWVRCIGGRLANGCWPERNINTGALRYGYG